MAWIDFAICFFLASCITSSTGIYYDCSLNSLQQCQGLMDGMEEVTDPEIFCPPLRAGQNCLASVQTSCQEDTTGVRESVQATLDAIETYLSLCPQEDSSVNMMMFNVVRAHSATTKEPWTEETSGNPSAEPVLYGSCSMSTAQSCNDPVHLLPPYATLSEQCTAWKSALECYQHLQHSCYEQDAMDYVQNGINNMHNNIQGTCDSWSTSPYPDSEPNDWSTSPYPDSEPNDWSTTDNPYAEPSGWPSTYPPYSEPHGDTTSHYPTADHDGVCNWDTAQGCGERVNGLGVYHSSSEKCSAWKDALVCYESISKYCEEYYVQEYVWGKITEMKDNIEEKCQYDCNWETATECWEEVDDLGYYASQSEKCEAWEGTRGCFESIKDNCHENDIYTFVEGKIYEMKNNMDANCHGTQTTRYPDAEPHNECNGETARQCAQSIDNIDSYASPTVKCSVWKGALQCFESMEHNCYDAAIQQYVYDKMGHIRQNIDGMCLDECTWTTFQYCSEPFQSLSGETDLKKICSTFQKGTDCFDRYLHDCDDETISQSVTQILISTETTMDTYCGGVDQNDDKCTWDKIYDCKRDLESAYSAKDKCREAGKTRQCLSELSDDCNAASDMDMRQKHRGSLAETEQFLNDCMYGNVDGSLTGDHDVKNPSLATSVRSSKTVAFLALMTTLLVNMIVKRL